MADLEEEPTLREQQDEDGFSQQEILYTSIDKPLDKSKLNES